MNARTQKQYCFWAHLCQINQDVNLADIADLTSCPEVNRHIAYEILELLKKSCPLFTANIVGLIIIIIIAGNGGWR